MGKRKTTKQFKKEVYELVGDEYRVLGEYVKAIVKIKMFHAKCNCIYEVRPSDFLRGSRCPKCFGTFKKTTEQFKNEVYKLVANEYEVLGEYVRTGIKLDIKHNECNHVYKVTPADFLHGYRCPKCSHERKRKTRETFIKEVYELVGNEYEVLGEYINNRTKIKMKHNICNKTYEVCPSNFLMGNRCPECFGNKRKTTKQFKQEVYELVGDEYIVLTKYVNALTKIKLKHNVCGFVYETKPNVFFNGSRCPKCFGKLKKTTEQFKEEVYELVSDEYTVLGEYKDAHTKIKMKHNKCNHEYIVNPSLFLRGSRCPKCFKNEKKTTEQFKEEVYELVGNEYEVLEEYKDTHTKIKMQHKNCEYIYNVTPHSFLAGSRCPKCFGTMKKTTEEFEDEIRQLVGNEYTLLGKYINNKTKIEIKHNKCDYIYQVTPNSLLGGRRCPKCSGKLKKTTEQFKEEVYELVGNEYIVLGEYEKNSVKIKIKHNKCGHVYKVRPYDFISGRRCPKCKISRGEEKILRILDKYKVKYKAEISFEGCKDKNKLRFDAAIFRDNEIQFLVEYDGEQHFKPIKRFGGVKAFEKAKKRDKIKNDYCRDNNISLIRIPYWEFSDIEKIILKKLVRLNLIQNPYVIE